MMRPVRTHRLVSARPVARSRRVNQKAGHGQGENGRRSLQGRCGRTGEVTGKAGNGWQGGKAEVEERIARFIHQGLAGDVF